VSTRSGKAVPWGLTAAVCAETEPWSVDRLDSSAVTESAVSLAAMSTRVPPLADAHMPRMPSGP
jgi:hypothetical protein